MSRPAPTAGDRRRRAERTGRWAEAAAALALFAKGYRILARRYRTPSGEIDLVARRRDIVAFVEVKQRPGLDEALAAVTPRARRRIERAADLFMARHPHLAGCAMRYDIVAVAARRFQHLRGAWRYGE